MTLSPQLSQAFDPYLRATELHEFDIAPIRALVARVRAEAPGQLAYYTDEFVREHGLNLARQIFPELEALVSRVYDHALFRDVVRVHPPSEAVTKPLANFGEFSVIRGRPDFLMGMSREEALRRLSGPTAIVLDYGQTKTRVVSVLIHGNELSGFDAMLKWLNNQPSDQPTNVVFLVQNVLAAQASDKPFSFRYLAESQVDLNREWAPQGASRESLNPYVATVYEFLNSLGPIDGFLDLHNNSGQNPAYAIMSYPDVHQKNLIASESMANFLTDQYLTMALNGGFDGGVRHMAPALAVECGYMASPASDTRALEIMTKFLNRSAQSIRIRNTELKPRYAIEASLRLAQRANVGLQIVGASAMTEGVFHLRPDIERFNFESVRPGTVLGHWNGHEWPVELHEVGGSKRDFTREYLELKDGRIMFRKRTSLAMATTHLPNIARSRGEFAYTLQRTRGRKFLQNK